MTAKDIGDLVVCNHDFVIPAGFEGQWEVLEATRELYAICQP